MKNIKKIFSFQFITIVLLLTLVILLTVLGIEAKNSKMKTGSVTKTNYNFDSTTTYCQKKYLYDSDNTYILTLCNSDLYIKKNNEDNVSLDIENAKAIYSYYTIGGQLFYILTVDGHVYELTEENIVNESYETTKLDMENITNIQDFYTGMNVESAYTYTIYGIDSENNLHVINK